MENTKKIILEVLHDFKGVIKYTQSGHEIKGLTENEFVFLAERLAKKLHLGSVSGSCAKLISEIDQLKRFDDVAWEEGGNTDRQYDDIDGSCIDADELDKILSNYR